MPPHTTTLHVPAASERRARRKEPEGHPFYARTACTAEKSGGGRERGARAWGGATINVTKTQLPGTAINRST